MHTFVQTDGAGRVTLVRRGPTQGDGPLMSATYSYYAASPGRAGDPGAPGTFGGDAIYGDYTVVPDDPGPPQVDGYFVNARSFEPGMAAVDPCTDDGGDNTEYFHTNHLGTTRFMSDPDGDPVDAAVYTAFGERLDGTNHRYGYDGAYGYQAHDFPEADPIPYLHVGARYYDPASGRFLQRDPIGIVGELNVYGYVLNQPTAGVDPLGLTSEGNCQDECDIWFPASAGACGGRTALEDCYASCLEKYCPPAPASPTPRGFTPWPEPCPPEPAPRGPGGPSPSGTWNGKAALALVVLFLLVLAILLRNPSEMSHAGAA
jgi:RHS repeat-associated protein